VQEHLLRTRAIRLLVAFLAAGTLVVALLSARYASYASVVLSRKQHELAELSAPAPQPEQPDTLRMPRAASVQETVSLITSLASEQSLQITSVAISHAASIGSKYGEVALDVDANAPYAATKSWLSAVLDGVPGIGVRNLSVNKGTPAAPLAVHVTFVLLVPA
jgi:hypothetical protein